MFGDSESASYIEQRESGVFVEHRVRLKAGSKHTQLHLGQGFTGRQENAVAHEATSDRAAVEKTRDLFETRKSSRRKIIHVWRAKSATDIGSQIQMLIDRESHARVESYIVKTFLEIGYRWPAARVERIADRRLGEHEKAVANAEMCR